MKITDQLRESMGPSWVEVMEQCIESDDFDNIFRQLKTATKAGKRVMPGSKDLFKALRLVSRDKVRVLFLGMCPYHTLLDKEPVADGLAFSCSYSEKGMKYQQPSLSTFYEGLTNDLGIDKVGLFQHRYDLSYLAEQGVLLLNVQLSVEEGKAGSHTFWDGFTRYLLENVISRYMSGVPHVLFGQLAGRYEKYIDPLKHMIKVVEHPAALSHRGGYGEWKHDKLFSWVNRILWDNNKYEIDWTGEKWCTKKDEDELPPWVTESMYEDTSKVTDMPWQDKPKER